MINDNFRSFARHLYFIQTDDMTCYEMSDESIQESFIDIFQNIHLELDEGLLTPEIAFFHAYVFALQINGRYDGYDTVEEKREIESLNELYPDEKADIIKALDDALAFYSETLVHDTNLQASWTKTWDEMKAKLQKTKKLYAENNILILT